MFDITGDFSKSKVN